jgi:ketosteroid isomerase-like protein
MPDGGASQTAAQGVVKALDRRQTSRSPGDNTVDAGKHGRSRGDQYAAVIAEAAIGIGPGCRRYSANASAHARECSARVLRLAQVRHHGCVSAEDVELIRRIYELWSRGERAGHLIDPQLEYVNPAYAVEAGTATGRKTLGRIRDVYPDFHVEAERFVDAGDKVVVIGVAVGTSTSGVEVRWRQGYVWEVRDGMAVSFSWFNDPAEALAAAGMEG